MGTPYRQWSFALSICLLRSVSLSTGVLSGRFEDDDEPLRSPLVDWHVFVPSLEALVFWPLALLEPSLHTSASAHLNKDDEQTRISLFC